MKQLIMTTLAASLFFSAAAQITTVKRQPTITVGDLSDGKRSATLKYTVEAPGDTTYALVYRDNNYKYSDQYEVISFVARNGEAQQLYYAFKQLFRDLDAGSKEPRADMTIGNNEVLAGTFETVAEKLLLVVVSKKGSFVLNERQLDKLFGK